MLAAHITAFIQGCSPRPISSSSHWPSKMYQLTKSWTKKGVGLYPSPPDQTTSEENADLKNRSGVVLCLQEGQGAGQRKIWIFWEGIRSQSTWNSFKKRVFPDFIYTMLFKTHHEELAFWVHGDCCMRYLVCPLPPPSTKPQGGRELL